MSFISSSVHLLILFFVCFFLKHVKWILKIKEEILGGPARLISALPSQSSLRSRPHFHRCEMRLDLFIY